jgi:translation initiation factor IF-1
MAKNDAIGIFGAVRAMLPDLRLEISPSDLTRGRIAYRHK